MNRAERRARTAAKLKQRVSMMDTWGLQGGTMYRKHREKIDKSTGYMRDGNVSHYVAVGFGQKTNSRNNRGKVYNPSIRDMKSISKQMGQVEEFNGV